MSTETLSKRELEALQSYRAGVTLQQIGEGLSVTRERARQIVQKALKKELLTKSTLGFEMDEKVFINEEKASHTRKRKPEKQIAEVKKKIPKRWSRYYSSCRNCGTTVIPHMRHGLCQYCIGDLRGETREKFIAEYGGTCQQCGITRMEAIAKHGRDFYLNTDTKHDDRNAVLCRSCFGSHMGKSVGWGSKPWSKVFDRCTKCGKIDYRHVRNGICESCFGRPSGAFREQIILKKGSKCEVCGMTREMAKKKYRRDLYLFGQGEGIEKLTLKCRRCFSNSPTVLHGR